jgi:hypothetical protein
MKDDKLLFGLGAIAIGGALFVALLPKFQHHANFTQTFNVSGGDDFDDIVVNVPDEELEAAGGHLHKIGWTMPFSHELYDTHIPYRKYKFLEHKFITEVDPTLGGRVSNDSFSLLDDARRADGFANYSRSFNVAVAGPPTAGGAMAYGPMMGGPGGPPIPGMDPAMTPGADPGMDPNQITPVTPDPMPVNSMNPIMTAAIADTDTVPSILVNPSMIGDKKVISLENQILKMIIANAGNTNVVLTNIDTIKASIRHYRHRLESIQEQLTLGAVTPPMFHQFLMQVISDIAQKLELPMNPQFTAQMNAMPYVPASPMI